MKLDHIIIIIAIVIILFVCVCSYNEHYNGDYDPLDGYTLCGKENMHACAFPVGRGHREISVKYGYGGKYVEKHISADGGTEKASINIPCTATSFDYDPVPNNVQKKCYYKNTAVPFDPLNDFLHWKH